MTKELTNSNIDRQNILNNLYAVKEIQKALGLKGVMFDNKMLFIKKQVAEFYDIDERTVERYLERYEEELKRNGYEVLSGEKLKKFKKIVTLESNNIAVFSDDTDTNVGIKTVRIGVFDFRSFLNLGMLITESEKAKQMRSIVLDIVIDTINKKAGGHTKYINQREENFLLSSFYEEDYRKKFTNALHECVDGGTAKFAIYTNKIYKSVFKENAREYRNILKLSKKDSTRSTLYSEILNVISAYENGLENKIRNKHKELGRKMTMEELDFLYENFEKESEAILAPHIHDSRAKMASRDASFRDALHIKLEEYIGEISELDFEKFLGEKSKELSKRIEENKDVFKRLKDR